MKTPAECKRFLRDLCTSTELRALAERFQVAGMIDQGVAYREISKQTGVSTTTITRVGEWLKNGEKGYELALNRIKKDRTTCCLNLLESSI